MASRRKKLLRNRAQCLHCHDIIESKHVHDYVSCSCGKLSVDGGKDYLRRGFPVDPSVDYIDLSEWEESDAQQSS